jgi:preprotein translocase subunit SecD
MKANVLLLLACVLPLSSAYPIEPTAAEPPKPAIFELRLVVDALNDDNEALTYTWFDKKGEKVGEEKLHVQKQALLDGSAIKSASYLDDPETGHTVHFSFNEKGTKKFADVTRANTGKPLAIVFDGKVLSAPVIGEAIMNGEAQVSGLPKEEAEQLTARLAALVIQNDTEKP